MHNNLIISSFQLLIYSKQFNKQKEIIINQDEKNNQAKVNKQSPNQQMQQNSSTELNSQNDKPYIKIDALLIGSVVIEISNGKQNLHGNENTNDNKLFQTTQVKQDSIKDKQQNSQSHKVMSSPSASLNKKPLSFILSNSKLLKQLFKHFCNISYADIKKRTFDQMLKQNETMTLNKFMLFCKEYNIYEIMKYQLEKEKENLMEKSRLVQLKQHQGSINRREAPIKMLEIPVKQVLNFERMMTLVYKVEIKTPQSMVYQEFVQAVLKIFIVFQKHASQLFPQDESLVDQQSMKDKFISDILFIKDIHKHRQKMHSLKNYLKGSISYHFTNDENTPQQSQQKYLKKPLITHGGRDPLQIKKELEVFKQFKLKKTQSWIGNQPDRTSVYSRSRIFYKPNPAMTYQTNDVIRLARNQMGQAPVQSLFNQSSLYDFASTRKPKLIDYSKSSFMKSKNSINTNSEMITFSEIFSDHTNTFSQKLQKMKQQFLTDGNKIMTKKQQQDLENDAILKAYFENQKKTYGEEPLIQTNSNVTTLKN